MAEPTYTPEDMKQLVEMSHPESVAANFLPDLDYDPAQFKEFLVKHKLSKDVHYLFEVPLEDIPRIMDKGEINGYIKWRFSIGK